VKTLVTSTIQNEEDLMKYMHETWKFQVEKGLQHGPFPHELPSKIYKDMFEGMPFSPIVKSLLRRMDTQFRTVHNHNYHFTFRYKGATFECEVHNCVSEGQAKTQAIGKLIHESNMGLNNPSLVNHLIHKGEIEYDVVETH
jgi:hypothetical protein